MLATQNWPHFSPSPLQLQQANHTQFLPARPSPLSPRSTNACPRPQFWSRPSFNFNMSGDPTHSRSRGTTPQSASENEGVPYGKRDIKTNSVIKRARGQERPDEARERRRGMFMRKVEEGREERGWGRRSEQILRSDYMAERRRWEADRDREATFIFQDPSSDYDEELPNSNASYPTTPRLQAQPDPSQEVDEMAQMEEEELRAMLEAQQAAEEEDANRMHAIPSSPTRYGSDDEDYDDLFAELLSSQPVPSSMGQAVHMSFEMPSQAQQEDEEMMDTT